ncbi:AbiJ-related protein [Paenibacillus macquariensis]|uniref:AbiJ-NTD3 domain-containing protein n=1 Tax=Paenibacillus macquariensis TaxID=948756 RepID=A0ABY1JKH2_9BACL|nr:hypothetical protein [Paenibacillus macquariensis]MEC0089934.1 hypothetical protein [Paenibacillus macquariensis]OAB31176.1 hypothetical protein PMSM_20880 [Paenibacillus macquariensis subsp. macquariensis]SIQ34591.1 hypothetical protein SAMN05421578_101320 [Paenibacillus macquariensis]
MTLKNLISGITSVLTTEKSMYLPDVCSRYGLEHGDVIEIGNSRRIYVEKRLKGKDQLFLIDLAKRVAKDYNDTNLYKVLNMLAPSGVFMITQLTRNNILKYLLTQGIEGEMDFIEFLQRTWDLDEMASTDPRYSNAREDIVQHVLANSDWDELFLYENILEIYNISDDQFIRFIENTVHPRVRKQNINEIIEVLNVYLANDGYKIVIVDKMSGYAIYSVIKTSEGVKGSFKNLIFAADGLKPKIVISDSINNDIKIVENEEHCLVYDEPILSGLNWKDLIKWWGRNNITSDTNTLEKTLYKRLLKSLDSEPEEKLFYYYFECFRNILGDEFPALIPQVYLHYDPYTVKKMNGTNHLFRQRMDFLLLLPNNIRIVIEVDGKQHYSDETKSSPKKYADMMEADRDLRLNGYEVYRFGGQEFVDSNKQKDLINSFFVRLFNKHSILKR